MRSLTTHTRSALHFATLLLVVFIQFNFSQPQVVSAAPVPKQAQPAPLSSPGAAVNLNVPATAILGQDVTFSVSFKNTGADTGYGPFIDLLIPATGVDGALGCPGGGSPFDGLGTTSISATYLGSPIAAQDFFVKSFNCVGVATHPLAKDGAGNLIPVPDPSVTPAPLFPIKPGDILVTIRLPFGSFTPTQPAATVNVTVNMSDLADVGTPLNIQARGGFQFGSTPLDDWCCDSVVSTITPWTSAPVTPILYTITKTYNGPEDETTTGPNFPRSYTLTVDIADGQPLTNLVVTDVLPSSIQFTSASSVPAFNSSSLPSTTTPGGTLSLTYNSITGNSAANDITITVGFFVPQLNSLSGDVIDPLTGSAGSSTNSATAQGDWLPKDTRDQAPTSPFTIPENGVCGTPCTHTLHDRSIAIQKSVSGNPAPNEVQTYTLTFQISDFFAFNNINITDILSDGQHMDMDPSLTPTLAINGNGYSLTATDMDASSYDIVCNYSGALGPECPPGVPSAPDGTTTVTFHVSQEIIKKGLDPSASGRMAGGCVDPAGGLITPCDPAHTGDGPTTGTIVFHTIIQKIYTDQLPSGDASVDQGDVINDNVTVSGDVLNTTTFIPTLSTVTDDSAAKVSIPTGKLTKEIYAVNGAAPGNPVLIKPGDNVTYRIEYDLPTSDEENMEFKDYLPLPIFNVGDPNATGGASVWAFDAPADPPPSAIIDSSVPDSGHAKFGPNDTFYNYTGQATGTPNTPMVPVLTGNPTDNTLDFYYGDFNDTRHQATHVDLLFTITVSSQPFADLLYLTNQVRGTEGSTQNVSVTADSIVQLVLTEPVLVHKKGVVATNNPNATFSPATVGPVAFNAPGTAGPRWSNIITSPGLKVKPIDSNVSSVDAGDLVTFAIVIENQGSSAKGAFDITIVDTLPSIYQIPASGMNLRVTNGDNSTTFDYSKPDGSDPNNPADLYTTGIKITDPDPNNGACQAHTVATDSNGKNIIIITYDLQVKDGATPGTYENSATLTHYAGSSGGTNFVPSTPPVDKASSTILTSMVKTLVGTEINNSTAHNDNTHAVIGELATYQIVVTVPEGIVPAAKIVDTLNGGLAFVSCLSVVRSSADLTTTQGTAGDFSDVCIPPASPTPNPVITNSGQTATWTLGDITNTNRNNSLSETLTIRYSVVVLNISGNQSETTLNNSATYSWTGGSVTDSAPNITVIQPVITTTKTAAGAPFDAGDTATYTVTLTNTGGSGTDAFDATWSDIVPADLTYKPGSLTFGTCPAATTSVNEGSAPNLSASISDILYNASCQLTFQATVNISVSPGLVITNTAQTQWTSLSGDFTTTPRSTYNTTNSTERTGAGGVNDYRSQGSVDINIRNVAADKSVIATSEADTSGSNVVIGEIIRYRVPIIIPEGTSPGTQVRDLLPPGLMFLNDGSTKIAMVSGDVASCPGSATMISTTIGSSAWVCGDETNISTITPTVPVPSGTISNQGTTNPFGDGDDPYFNLGTIVNSDNDANQEFIILEYNALVTNVSGNQDGTTLNNQYEVWVGTTRNNTSSIASVKVVESDVTLSKTNSVISAIDAGDTITYTITIANNGANAHAPAYDSHFTDTLPADLTLIPSSVSATFGGGASGLTNNSTGNVVDLTITTIPVNDQVVVTYQATVNNSVTPQQAINNTGNLTWTSLPSLKGTPSNVTGSTTPGNSGDTNGERNGSGGTNDYTSSATSRVTVAGVGITKVLVRTSDSDTTGNNVTIGEVITYGILFTVPEGTVPADIVVDTLPAGLSLVAGSSQIITAAASSSGHLTADYNGTFGSSITEDTSTGKVTFTFSNIDTPGDNKVNNNTLLLQYQAVVLNNSGNVGIPATTLTNSATNQIGSGPVSTPVSVTTTVVESKLTITKSVSDDHPAPGEILTFTLKIEHDISSRAGAFDLSVNDILPAGLTNINSISISPSGGASGVTDTSSGSTVSATVDNFPLGSTLTITFKATIISALKSTVDNTGSVTWTSLPSSDLNERTGTGTGPNNYIVQSLLSLTVDRNLTKNITSSTFSTIDLTNVRVGDILTYQVILTIPANTTDTAIVVDNLPSGLAFVDCAATPIAAGAGISTSSPTFTFNTSGNCAGGTTSGSMPLIENSGQRLTFNFGTIHNATATVETITITYRAVVLDIASNINNVLLDNNVTWTWGSGNISTSAGPVTIQEAKLEIVKTVDPAIAIRGSMVTFTIKIDHSSSSTAAAYDARMTDGIPTGMTLNQASIVVTPSTGLTAVPVITSSPTQFSIYWSVFPLGENATITFAATYNGPGAVVNSANVEWSSIQIDPALRLSTFNQFSTIRFYSPTNLAVDNYFATSSASIRGPKGLLTGFAPGQITLLPPQPEDKSYQDLGNLWLEVPRLGLKLSIAGIPLGDGGEWDLTWLANQAGYLDGTAYPTHAGNSVITGHVYMADGTPGPFINLHTLQYGDQIIVHLNGQSYLFEVRSDVVTSPNDNSGFKHEIYPWLTLITCKDYDAATNTYAHRVVVRAVLIKIETDTPPSSGDGR